MRGRFAPLLAATLVLAMALAAGCSSSGGTTRVYGSVYYGFSYYDPWYWRHYWYRPPYWRPPAVW